MRDSYSTMTYDELVLTRNELKKKFFDLRFQMVIGHVDNPLQRRNLKRKIARLNTRIRLHEIAEAAKVSAQAK